MKLSRTTLLLNAALLTGCASSMEHAFYNGIQNRSEGYKTPDERAMNPVPSYHIYKKEREGLNKNVPSEENKQTPTINDK